MTCARSSTLKESLCIQSNNRKHIIGLTHCTLPSGRDGARAAVLLQRSAADFHFEKWGAAPRQIAYITVQLSVKAFKRSKRVFRKGCRALYLTPLELPEKLQKLTVRRLSCHTPCLAMLVILRISLDGYSHSFTLWYVVCRGDMPTGRACQVDCVARSGSCLRCPASIRNSHLHALSSFKLKQIATAF